MKRIINNKRGQIAIVIILLIAIGLIFYAAALNMGKVAQGKVIATISSNLGAALLVSYMASYGEQVFQEQLGGERKVCGYTGVFKALMIIVIMIIIIVVCIFTCGAGGAVLGVKASTIISAAVVGAVMAAVSLVIQLAVIEPAITAAWNDIIWENMSMVDAFMEQGVGTAIRNAVTDQTEIPDLLDIDMDGSFGLTDPTDPRTANDTVSRFAYYYLRRVKKAPLPPDLGSFMPCLCQMVFVDDQLCQEYGYEDNYDETTFPAPTVPGTDCLYETPPCEALGCSSPDWGFYDPLPCGITNNVWGMAGQPCCPANRLTDPNFPAMCDPCCQPQYVPSNLPDATTPDAKQWILCQDGTAVPPPAGPVSNPCDNTGPDLIPNSGDDSEPALIADPCCYLPAGDPDKCGDPTTCTVRSPYYNQFLGPSNDTPGNYPWVFDPHYEDANNNFVAPGTCPAWVFFRSCRERMGRDDEHKDYNVMTSNPNWHDSVGLCGGGGGQCPGTLPPDAPAGPGADFYIKDATGFYDSIHVLDEDNEAIYDPLYNPPIVTVKEEKLGIFPFFYKMQDWGIDLRGLNLTFNPADTPAERWDDYHCYWCDMTFPDPTGTTNPIRPECNNSPAKTVDPNIEELIMDENRLNLALDPSSAAANLSGGWCVDNHNLSLPAVPLKADNVTNLLGLGSPVFAVDGTCPIQSGGWRRGFDKYCAQEFPYERGCAKNLGYHNCEYITNVAGDLTPVPMDCICAPAPGDERSCNAFTGICTGDVALGTIDDFPDDELDQILIEFHEFFDWAVPMINRTESRLATKLRDWYSEAADWIEPACPNCTIVGDDDGCPDASCCNTGSDSDCPGSYTNKVREGKLHSWRRVFEKYDTVLYAWLMGDSYMDPLAGGGGVDDYAWCIPNNADPRYACAPMPMEILTGERTALGDFDTSTPDPGNPVEGDIYDILDCLFWNAEDTVMHPVLRWGAVELFPLTVSRPPHMPAGDDIDVVGNALKFRACHEACTPGSGLPVDMIDFFPCYNLPRSLDPAFCPLKPFNPPFGVSKWTACQATLIPNPPGPAMTYAEALSCATACGAVNFWDYPGYFDPSGIWYQPPQLDETTFACPDTNPDCPIYGPPPAAPGACKEPHSCVAGTCVCRQLNAASYTDAGSCDDPAFATQVAQIISDFGGVDTLGSCDPAGSFMPAVQNSETQAYNQVEKFKYRLWFLSNRVREAEYVYQTVHDPYVQLEAFLDNDTPYDLGGDGILGTDDENPNGIICDVCELPPEPEDNLFDSPSEGLVWQRAHLDRDANSSLPSTVIYVWEDPPLPTRTGLRHAVKVEARLPKRCNNACVATRWPYVKTESHTVERCYKLAATTGRVKVRTIRFDEERDSTSTMRFPDGTAIWQIMSRHPKAGSPSETALDGTMATCQPFMDEILRMYPWGDPSAGANSLGYSFMLDFVPTTTTPVCPAPPAPCPEEILYNQCWRAVHFNMLEFGVVSETCAQYYFAGGDAAGPEGFKMQFVPCDDAFLRGEN